MLDDKLNCDDKIESAFRTLAAELYPLITSIQGNAFFLKQIIENDDIGKNRARLIQILERILEKTDALETIQVNLKGKI